MNINYTISDNCRETVLYEPAECLKLYNCLNIKDFNEEVDSIQFINNTNLSKSFDAKVVRINDNQIFFGPAFSDIANIANWTVLINGVEFEINEDNFINIGSLLLPSIGLATYLNKAKTFRIINETEDIYTYLTFSGYVNTKKTKLYGQPFIEVVFDNSEELSDFIKNNDNLYIQAMDQFVKQVNIPLYLYVADGEPFVIDGEKRYKLILEDLVYNTTEEKFIKPFGHREQLRKSRYNLWTEDKNGSIISKVNGLDFFEGKISLDTTSLNNPVQFMSSRVQSKKNPPSITHGFEAFMENRLL